LFRDFSNPNKLFIQLIIYLIMKITITTKDKNLDKSVDAIQEIVLEILAKYPKAKAKMLRMYHDGQTVQILI